MPEIGWLLYAENPVAPICRKVTHGIAPALYSKLGYDAVRDFSPLSMIGTTPNVLIVNPSVQARSVGEFIALAKAAQRKLDYGSPGIGTSPQLSMELFKLMSGIELVHIPYKGNAPRSPTCSAASCQ